jgi:cation transport ATPase
MAERYLMMVFDGGGPSRLKVKDTPGLRGGYRVYILRPNTQTHTHTHRHTHTHDKYTHTHTHACIHIHTHTHMHTHVHTHAHTKHERMQKKTHSHTHKRWAVTLLNFFLPFSIIHCFSMSFLFSLTHYLILYWLE